MGEKKRKAALRVQYQPAFDVFKTDHLLVLKAFEDAMVRENYTVEPRLREDGFPGEAAVFTREGLNSGHPMLQFGIYFRWPEILDEVPSALEFPVRFDLSVHRELIPDLLDPVRLSKALDMKHDPELWTILTDGVCSLHWFCNPADLGQDVIGFNEMIVRLESYDLDF